MIEHILHPLSAIAALAIGGVLMSHVKGKGSSVLLHHATHGRLHPNRRHNHLLGQSVAIACLSMSFESYRAIHGRHHAFPSFAQAGLDSEADELVAEGFRPGHSERELWRLFWTRPFSPSWHVRHSWARMRANFLSGSWRRLLAAWGVWGGAAGAAAATGTLPAYSGVLLTLLVAGNVGSYLELTSRHVWAITPPETGKARQLALSRWRLPSPTVPLRWTARSTTQFAGDVLLKTLLRFSVLQADLSHHAAHHLAWDAGGTDAPVWTDAAQSFSDRLRADRELWPYVYGSLLDAVAAWFEIRERLAVPP